MRPRIMRTPTPLHARAESRTHPFIAIHMNDHPNFRFTP